MINQQLITVLGTAIATSVSFNVLILTFVLGEYVSLDQNDAHSRQKRPFKKTGQVLIVVLWLGGVSLIGLLIGLFTGNSCLLSGALLLFILQLTALIGGLTWFSRQYLLA